MPLDPEEIVNLSPKAAKLIDQIGKARKPNSEGGRTITRREAGRVLRATLALAAQLVIDLLD